MANELDEMTGPVNGAGRDVNVIDKKEGSYVLMTFNSNPDFPRELERNFKNDEAILRYLVTRKEA